MKDICAKWKHFSEQEVSALKSKADLVTQVAAKYGLDRAQAQREVDSLFNGRQIGATPRAPFIGAVRRAQASVLFPFPSMTKSLIWKRKSRSQPSAARGEC